ncbi:MAG: carboxypeptidase regulatory-like domain-containing protein [Sedimentisphaerales bacterium]|nr:carboxypeptidase regulatory-like domain-containing protein [Sedimentisphaerales bacterium]
MKVNVWCVYVFLVMSVTAQALEEIHGTVRDPNGVPLEGVKIQVVLGGREVVKTDQDGSYTIAYNPRFLGEDGPAIHIVAQDRLRNLAVALPVNPESDTQDLVLRPALTIAGRVADANDRGIANAQIRVTYWMTSWGTTMDPSGPQPATDAQGRFEITALPTGSRYSLAVTAEGYGRTNLSVDASETVDRRLDVGRMTLAAANRIVSGQVVDSEGRPLEGIRLRIYGEGQPDGQTTTDDEGRFTLNVCEGAVGFMAEGRLDEREVSCRATTMAGTMDVRLVVTPGRRSAHRYIRSKPADEILTTGKFVAGRAVDESGQPVAGVPVNVNAIRREREPGRFSWTYSNYNTLGDITDREGRFIIEVEEDAAYCLLFSPVHQAALMVYDLPMGTKDYEVILPEGGTVTGRLVRLQNGQKVPVADTEVRIAQTSRASYSHLGFDQDRTTKTDAQGRFRFEHLRRLYRSDRYTGEQSTRIWEVSSLGLTQTVGFFDDAETVDIELVVKPKLEDATPLKGKPLPAWETLGISVETEPLVNKRVLVCFFDYEQRLGRRGVSQLARQVETLAVADVAVVAVDVSSADVNALQAWADDLPVSLMRQMTTDRDEARFNWNVQSLPWLILTDAEHAVVAEGFSVEELGAHLAQMRLP